MHWFQLGARHWVLELDERAGLALELHLVRSRGVTVAWWIADPGARIWWPTVGKA